MPLLPASQSKFVCLAQDSANNLVKLWDSLNLLRMEDLRGKSDFQRPFDMSNLSLSRKQARP